MKKKTLGLIIAGVAAASMIGTGFAAWIITANASAEKTGQFKVDAVTEKSLTITPSFAEGEGTVNFLAPENATSGWLTSDAANGTVKLSTDLTVGFTTSGTGSKASDFKVTYAIDYSSVQDAIDAKYITAPTLKIGESTTVTDVALTSTTTTDTVTLTIEFGWGDAFGGVNPYTFYNTFAYDTAVVATAGTTPTTEGATTESPKIQTVAKDALDDLYDIVNGVEFTITITAKPVTVA